MEPDEFDPHDHGNHSEVEIIDRLPRWAHMLALGIYIVLLMLAFSANSLVIFTVWRVKSMRRSVGGTMNVLLGNLALADLLLAISTTLEAAAVFRHSWELGLTACKMQRWFMYTFYAVSMLSLIVISGERYYAICDPLNIKAHVLHIPSQSRVMKTILAIWVVASLLESPQLYLSDLEYTHRATVCKDVQPLPERHYIAVLVAYYMPMFILLYALPVVIFSLTFYKIGRKLRGLEDRLRERTRYDVLIAVQKRKRVMRVLLAVVVIFLCCWTPFNCVQLISRVNDLAEYDPLGNFYVSIKMLALCHAVLSPMVWTLMGQQFRDGLKRAMRIGESDRRKHLQAYHRGPNCECKTTDLGLISVIPEEEFRPRLKALEPRDFLHKRSQSDVDLLLTCLTPKVTRRRLVPLNSQVNDGMTLEPPSESIDNDGTNGSDQQCAIQTSGDHLTVSYGYANQNVK